MIETTSNVKNITILLNHICNSNAVDFHDDNNK